MGWKSVLLVLRVIVGMLFLVAGFSKLLLPTEEFSQILRSYQIIPEIFIGSLSIVAPGIELLTGSFLVLGLFTRLISLMIALQLLAFIALMSLVIASGIEIGDCGCFSGLGFHETPVQVLIRDGILLIMVLPVLFAQKHNYALDGLFEGGKG